MTDVFSVAEACIRASDPDAKCALADRLDQGWRQGILSTESVNEPVAVPMPGRPDRPCLVPPRDLPRRKLTSDPGRAALIHALAHIEFNAINLACDAVYRFRGMPAAFYGDWAQVAAEEAYHFGLLRDRLRDLGYRYGDFDAHNGLWEMACKTAHDVMVRMALVPRVLEARGLDVTPGMMQRLRSAGDDASADVLEIILRDEIGHVAIGSRWFRFVCEQRGLDSEQTFLGLIDEYMKGQVKGPLYEKGRQQAGFSERELEMLMKL